MWTIDAHPLKPITASFVRVTGAGLDSSPRCPLWFSLLKVTALQTRQDASALIYRRTKNLRAVQLLLGHSKLESTVRYLGIEVDDALEMAEQTEV
jgi:hypothetical protein